MNSKNKERRVINIDMNDFDVIKKYCDDNALNMSKWLVKIAKDLIIKEKIKCEQNDIKRRILLEG